MDYMYQKQQPAGYSLMPKYQNLMPQAQQSPTSKSQVARERQPDAAEPKNTRPPQNSDFSQFQAEFQQLVAQGNQNDSHKALF